MIGEVIFLKRGKKAGLHIWGLKAFAHHYSNTCGYNKASDNKVPKLCFYANANPIFISF